MKLNVCLMLFFVCLCGCSSQEPVEAIDDLPLAEISKAEPFNGALETVLDRVMLNVDQAWGNRFSKTDRQFLYLPEGSRLHDPETLELTLKEALSDWQFDREASFRDVTVVFRRKSRIGEQTFVATRLPLLAGDGVNVYSDDAILMLSLYPVKW